MAVITNDQGETLVDTMPCRHDDLAVTEIPGGCFCCRYAAERSDANPAPDELPKDFELSR